MQKVREVVADAVVSSGTTTVFGLMGAANQELICDLGARAAVCLVHCRHEGGAVGMADGYSRFSDQVGVATVTAGPGVTNTATSLAVARAHRSPVLLLAGDTPDRDPRNPQFFDQDSFARMCAGSGRRIQHPGEVDVALREAADSLAADLPFALHLPAGVQEMPTGCLAAADLRASAAADLADAAHDAEAAEAVRLLMAAQRPVVLAGRGALGAGTAVSELAELLGAPLVSTLRAAGLFAGHALEAGSAGAMGDGRAQKLLEDADLVLVVGTSLHPLAASTLIMRRSPAVIVRIDTMPAAEALVCGADLCSDARAGARLLLQRLTVNGACPAPTWHRPTAEARDVVSQTCDADGVVHPLEALDSLRTLLPRDRDDNSGRYQAHTLPELPFPDDSFTLAVSGFLLFTYPGTFDLDFHLRAIRSLLRVASDVRLHPLNDSAGNPYPELQTILEHLTASGVKADLLTVPGQSDTRDILTLRLVRD